MLSLELLKVVIQLFSLYFGVVFCFVLFFYLYFELTVSIHPWAPMTLSKYVFLFYCRVGFAAVCFYDVVYVTVCAIFAHHVS